MFPEQLPAEKRAPDSQLSDGVRPKSTKVRIDYLDGLRGIAALAVAILHAFQMFGFGLEPLGIQSDALMTGQGLDRFIPPLFNNLIQFGAYAVEVFIVLSGYSLMLGVARSADGKLKGGLTAYFKRRIKRIWPPYYAALAVSLLIIFLIPGMNTESGRYWDLAIPVTPDGLLGHVFFMHYLSSDWFYQINPPMWTVALEEHIYIIFPFLLLPLWRRFGTLQMAIFGVVSSALFWHALSPWFGGANFWFVGLFSLGAAAASISFAKHDRLHDLRNRLPWGKLSVVFLVLFFAMVQFTLRVNPVLDAVPWLKDYVLGAGIASLLIHYTEIWKGERTAPSLSFFRLLRTPPVVNLGIFSYSLYLMHAPVLAMLALIISSAGFVSTEAYALIVLAGVPIAVLMSYLFHLVFERPFMPVHVTGSQGVRPLGWLRSLRSGAQGMARVRKANVD